MRGLASDIFDRRLDPCSRAPIAVAFSGGADSLLTLLAAKAWADRHARPILALSVDHRLQPASAGWTRQCAARAAQLGVDFQALTWEGAKPRTGIPAAARGARHRLISDAARHAGARVVLFGHTGSDIDEGEAMRAEGANIGRLREWSPSPVWPEGRDLFCLRPLLKLRRDEVRRSLSAEGWDWIDDPANEDQRFARSRARRSLEHSAPASKGQAPGGWPNAGAVLGGDDRLREMAKAIGFSRHGALAIDRDLAQDGAFPQLLQIALLCVSGGEAPARRTRVEALARRLAQPAPVTATLGGCRIRAGAREIVIARDAGEAKRGGMQALALAERQARVWDGRFELVADRPGLAVRGLAGLAARLSKPERARLCALPAAVRGGLPAVVVDGAESVTCPILAEASQVRCRALAAGRLLAACDLIAHEAAANRLAHGEFTFDVLSWARELEKGRSE